MIEAHLENFSKISQNRNCVAVNEVVGVDGDGDTPGLGGGRGVVGRPIIPLGPAYSSRVTDARPFFPKHASGMRGPGMYMI